VLLSLLVAGAVLAAQHLGDVVRNSFHTAARPAEAEPLPASPPTGAGGAPPTVSGSASDPAAAAVPGSDIVEGSGDGSTAPIGTAGKVLPP